MRSRRRSAASSAFDNLILIYFNASIGRRRAFGPGADGFGDVDDLGHGADADVAAGESLRLRRDEDRPRRVGREQRGGRVRRPVRRERVAAVLVEPDPPQVAACGGLSPHQRIHRRREDDGLVEIPRAIKTRQKVVGQAQREFRQGVGVERCDDQDVRPSPAARCATPRRRGGIARRAIRPGRESVWPGAGRLDQRSRARARSRPRGRRDRARRARRRASAFGSPPPSRSWPG